VQSVSVGCLVCEGRGAHHSLIVLVIVMMIAMVMVMVIVLMVSVPCARAGAATTA
jgi:hypothetical protein